MFTFKTKPPDQWGGGYDPSSLSQVTSFGDIPASIRADPARFGSLGEFILNLAGADPITPAAGTILARRSATATTNGWLDFAQFFMSMRNSLPNFPDYLAIDELLAGVNSSLTPIRFILRNTTRPDSFVEFELANRPAFFEGNNAAAREISFSNAQQSDRSSAPNAFIQQSATLFPHTIGLTGLVWKSGSYRAVSTIYGLNSFWLWYNNNFMRLRLLANETISTQGMRYEYMLPGGTYANAATAPFPIPSSITSGSQRPMNINLKRDITLSRLTPVIQRQSGIPYYNERYELFWVYAGGNNYLTDMLISSGIITKSITDINTNIGIINSYNATINTLNIEINTSSLLSSAAETAQDNLNANRQISCSLYSTNLEVYQGLSTAYVSTLSSYEYSVDAYIGMSTYVNISTQAYQSSIRGIASTFSSIQDAYNASIRDYNLKLIIKPGLEASLPILYRISTLYALNDQTALNTLYREYPNLSTFVENYESTLKGPAVETTQAQTYTGTFSTLSAGKWIQKAVVTTNFDEYFRAFLGIGGGGDAYAADAYASGIVQEGGGTRLNPSLTGNPFFRIGRISEVIRGSEVARSKRATLQPKEDNYTSTKEQRDSLFSTFYKLDLSSLAYYDKWQGFLSSKTRLDTLYTSSLTEYNTAYVAYTTIYNQVAYLSSYRDEIISFSTLEHARQRKRLLDEALDQFNAGYDGTPLYTAAIQSGGATAADVNIALQTQQVLINTAESAYTEKQNERIIAEAKISQDRSGPLESTIAGYNTLISNYLDEMTLYIDKVSTTQSSLRGLSTQWLTTRSRRIQSTFVIERFASTSTFYGRRLEQLRSDFEITSRNRFEREIAFTLRQLDLADALTNLSTNIRDRAERVDEIAALCKRYEEAQRSYSTIVDSMKSYATLFEQQYVAPTPLPFVDIQQIRALYGIPAPAVTTAMIGGDSDAPPTYVTQTDIAALNALRVAETERFKAVTGVQNSTIRSLAHKELSTYSVLLTELSTTIEADLSLKRFNFALNRQFDGTADPLSTFGYRALPNYGRILGLRQNVQVLLAQLEVERNTKDWYIQMKANYDLQVYYSKTAAQELGSTLTKTDFDVLKTQFDYSIQSANANIFLRKSYFDSIKSQIVEFSTTGILDRLLATNFATEVTSTNIPSRQKALFDMSFNAVPLRINYFTDPAILQETQTPVCPVVPSTPAIVDRLTPVDPTTTAPQNACGYPIRFIDITHPNDIFHLTQIIAVDRTGRNVAFGASVTLTPTAFQTAKGAGAAVLTNGLTYSTELAALSGAVSQNFTSVQGQDGAGKRIRVDLGREFEITLVGVYIVPNSGYDTTSLQITTRGQNTNLSPATTINPTTITANVSPVFADRRAPTASATCPIAILPQRRGICGLFARYVRIYPPSDAPAGYAFTFSQIAVVDSNGTNVALGDPVTFKPASGAAVTTDSNSVTMANILTTGVYFARPSARCIRRVAGPDDYLSIDLGREFDIAAVHIYNQIGGTSLLGCSVRIYTDDYLLAQQRIAISNDRREIIDFRYNGADSNCSKLIRWPSVFGEAGIKTRYIHLYRPPIMIARTFMFETPVMQLTSTTTLAPLYEIRFILNNNSNNTILLLRIEPSNFTGNTLILRRVVNGIFSEYSPRLTLSQFGITAAGGQTISIAFDGRSIIISSSVAGTTPHIFRPVSSFLFNDTYNTSSIGYTFNRVLNPREVASTTTYGLLNIKVINRDGRNISPGKSVQVFNATTNTRPMLTNSIYPSTETFLTPINPSVETQIMLDLGEIVEVCAVEAAGLSPIDTDGLHIGFSVSPSSNQLNQISTRTFQLVTPRMPIPTTTDANGWERFGVDFRNPNGDIIMRLTANFFRNGSAMTSVIQQSRNVITNTWSTSQTQTHANYGITREGGQILTITADGQRFIIRSLNTGFSFTYTPPVGFISTYDVRTLDIRLFYNEIQNFTEVIRFTEPTSIINNSYQQFTLFIQRIGIVSALWTTGDFNTLFNLFGLYNPFFSFFRQSSGNLLRIRITFISSPRGGLCHTLIEKEISPQSNVWTPVVSTDGIPIHSSLNNVAPLRIQLLTISPTFDSRYDPEDSTFPISETKPLIQFGNSGLFAQHVLLPLPNVASPTLLADTQYSMTDVTGKSITQIDSSFQRSIVRFDGNPYMKVSFTRIWELTAVGLVGAPGVMIVVLDCNENIEWIDLTSRTAHTANIFIADFRKPNPIDGTRAEAPVHPYPMRFGPLNKGVLTRYIQVEPMSSTEGLYISQIIAVNACGRNSAFERETFASSGGATAALAVDGRYENQLALNSSPVLLYDNYLKKPLANSYQSGPASGLKWIVDLGRIFSLSQGSTATLTGISNAQTFCTKMISNTACGGAYELDSTYEHEINCVIFVAPEGKKADCVGVIVKLLDGTGQVVGLRRVSSLVNIFGVDFLDFRRNTAESLATSIVEIPQRPLGRGPNGCGIMAMYIRIEQEASSNPSATTANPIRLSQIFVLDHQGRNIALYKPTKSNQSGPFDTSFLAVDGRYFSKDENGSFVSDAAVGQYIEVNLGCEMPVTKIMAIRAQIDTNDLAFFNTLVVKVYNQTRDVLLVQRLSSTASNSWTIANTNYTNKIDQAGVNIQDQFFKRAFDEGIIPTLPGIPPKTAVAPVTLATCDPAFDLSTLLQRGDSIYKGVLTSYIRIYNPNSHIQISQLMIYDNNLTNIARTLPQSRVFATHALPGRQAERAVDGAGGYFHVGRPEAQCYISERKSYEFWQIDVRTDTGQPREIVAVRYIPPSTNRSRNKGLRFQLIQTTAPPIPIGGAQERYFEVRWPAVPASIGANESASILFKSKANAVNQYLQFSSVFKENNSIVSDTNIIRMNGPFTSRTAPASTFGLTRDGETILYFSFSPTTIKIKNAQTGYEYPTITLTSTIATDDIVYDFWPTNYIREVDAGSVSQYVVSEYVLYKDVYDQTIDFRMPTLNPRPITDILSPKCIAPGPTNIYNRLSTTMTNPMAIAQDSGGNLYIASGRNIHKFTFTATTNSFTQAPFIVVNAGTGITINAIAIDSGNRIWFTTSAGLLLSTTSVLSATALTTATAFSNTAYRTTINSINMFGLFVTDTTLYVTKAEEQGALYTIDRTTGTTTLRGTTMNFPAGITIRTEGGKQILYVCCRGEYKVSRFDIAANFTELTTGSIGIGISDTNTQVVSEKMYVYLKDPYSIFTDTNTNTLYITDYLGNQIYYIPPDPSPGIDAKVYTLAGTGDPGNFTPTNGPAIDALLNGPTSGLVHTRTGNYIFTDYVNNSLRVILLDQTATITTFTDKVVPQTQWATTTIPGEDIAALPSIPILPQALNRTRDTIKELANTGRLQTSS